MKTVIQEIFKSNFCKIIFILAFILSYFLIPKTVFEGYYRILAVTFMAVFALVVTCVIRNIKDRIKLAKTYKSSTLGLIATIIGLSALQVCGAGALMCGATFGVGILSLIFPIVVIEFITKYSMAILFISIIFQLLALYFMGCFKRCIICKN